MIDSKIRAAIQKDLQVALDAITAKYGVNAARADVRQFRGGIGVRIMKTDMMVVSASAPKAVNVTKIDVNGVDPLLAQAMKRHGITSTKNDKGDTLTAFFPNSPKFCFGYTSARGAEWKCSADQAARRFN